jgi:hypothetical protein
MESFVAKQTTAVPHAEADSKSVGVKRAAFVSEAGITLKLGFDIRGLLACSTLHLPRHAGVPKMYVYID